MPQIKAVEVRSERDFDGLRTVWTRISGELAGPTPFDSWEWNRLWWEHFGTGHRLCLVLFEVAGEAIGIAQLYERRIGPFRFLAPLGWESFEGRYGITERIQLLFPDGRRTLLLSALWKWLMGHGWTSVVLPVAGAETLPLPIDARVVKRHTYQFFVRDLPENWPLLVAGLNKSMRDNVKYYPKLLLRSGLSYTFHVARSADEVSACLPTLLGLHEARAQASNGIRHRDYFATAPRKAFIVEAAPRMASRGQAQIGLLHVNGELAAAQMWLEREGTLFLYYSGSSPSWAKYSVAMIATSEVLKDAIARGLKRVDFLRGPGHFKYRWGVEERTEGYAILAHHPRVISILSRASGGWRKRVRWLVPALR